MSQTSATSPVTMANDTAIGTEVWVNPNNAKVSDSAYAQSNIDVVGEGIRDYVVSIVKSDGTVGSTNKADTGANWPYTASYASYGSSSDLWGETWSYTDINDVDFGIVISATGMSGGVPYIISNYLKATNFGFTIPSGATIDGIVLEFKRLGDGDFMNADVDHIRVTIYYTAGADYPMTASQASFTLTGQTASFHLAWKSIISVGNFTLTGFATALRIGKGILATMGSFTTTWQDFLIHRTISIPVVVGNFVLTGQNVALHYGRMMVVSVGNFVLTGQTVLLKLGWKMTAVYGSVTLSGQTVLLKVGRYMSAVYDTFTLTGQTVLLHIGRKMTAVYGSFVLTGKAILFAINGLYVRWANAVKTASATFANSIKNSSTFSNVTKNVATWINGTKNY